jgi:alginate O-acetyltransferase complex protein AlgI
MIFASPVFLFAFLPAVIMAYYAVPAGAALRGRNLVLLCGSYFFYIYGAGDFALVLALSTLADFGLGRLIAGDRRRRRLYLGISLLLNLGLLAYFKYANFLAAELNALLPMLGRAPFSWQTVLLPIGISFFTFQKLSYIFDVYRERTPALRNPLDFALYVAMFPQLIAGPIVRFDEIRRQLHGRRASWDAFYTGGMRICWGLAKKVLIADACGRIADAVFDLGPGALDTKSAWLGALAYTLQIYFDFSAYADMAIGLGQLFGFTLPENFRRPYSAVSVTDFWRRWHMSLTRWFRDYLYIPLGGNRGGRRRTCLNLGLVFLLCGLWHGANWTFVVWGLYHGGLLMAERASGVRDWPAERWPFVRRALTLLLVMMGWVLFRAADLHQALAYAAAMWRWQDYPSAYELLRQLHARNLAGLLTGLLVFFLPRDFSFWPLLVDERQPLRAAAAGILLLLLLPYCAALLVGGPAPAFIYFRF